MATVSHPPPDLSSDELTLYQTTDPLLLDSPILIFYGPVATTNSHVTSSRIQAHIFAPAGFQSFSRVTVSPAAPLYAAVHHLPREKQGDEICRGLAVVLLKYFAELPEPVKNALVKAAKSGRSSSRLPKMFDEMHAAELAGRMMRMDKNLDLVRSLQDAYREKKISWVDIDVALPHGSITPNQKDETQNDQPVDGNTSLDHYGQFSPIIKAFGEPVFLPTSKLRRAPSQSTNTSKSKTFAAQQKEALRRTMCEFVDTEERYVNKLYDLVNNVVEDFRQKAGARGPSSGSPDEAALASLFPPCLNQILDVNVGFLNDVRQVLEETEQQALADLPCDTLLVSAASRRVDSTGSVAFAKILLQWLPRFAQPYEDYMRAHGNFSKILNDFLRDSASSFSRRVQETGEQLIRSLLMEPVQRLPRYSLFIDTMTGSLPSVHPAVKHLLKARDIVTQICSLESASSDTAGTLRRLQEMVLNWPGTATPKGRVILAFDQLEVGPPFTDSQQLIAGAGGITVVFQDCMILLTKADESSISSRGLLAELEKPAQSSANTSSAAAAPVPELIFSESIPLHQLSFCHSADARLLYITYKTSQTQSKTGVRAFVLAGSYESKAAKLDEELVKALIEGRYPESEREDGKWVLLSPTIPVGDLGLLAAISEEGSETTANPRSGCSNIRVVFNKPKIERTRIMNSSAVEIVASISEGRNGHYRLEIDSQFGSGTSDSLHADDIVNALRRRIAHLLQPAHQPRNPTLAESLVNSHFNILRYAATNFFAQMRGPRSFRPPSPTKLISSVLGSALMKDNESPSKKASTLPVMRDIPRIAPPSLKLATSKSQPSLAKVDNSSKITLVAENTHRPAKEPMVFLEETFEAYLLALRSRAGNIVGKTLRTRGAADELEVNELYNVLLESPANIQAAAEVSVDVLFAAFEKFLRVGWKGQVGPVFPIQAMQKSQQALDSRSPQQFENTFKNCFGELAPQNKRAFSSMIKLLAELLDASGNDGDRGALTATFAEFLNEGSSALEFVSLLDRLIEDFERLFDDSLPSGTNSEVRDVQGSVRSHKSGNTGSVSSNTSSFRKKFGFGFHWDSNKTESEGKVSSIIRTLSKTKVQNDSESAPSSFSKATSLLRTKSTDMDSRPFSFSRPSSRDRPGMLGAFGFEEQPSRPGSAHNALSVLASIGEKPTVERQQLPKKKRRSSLSDLQSLQSSPAIAMSPAQLRMPTTPTRPTSQRSNAEPKRTEIPTPSKSTPSLHKLKSPSTPTATVSVKPSFNGNAIAARTGSPARNGSPTRSIQPSRRENMPPPKSTLTERAVNRKSDENIPTTPSLQKRVRQPTNLPGPKSGGLSEKPLHANGNDSPTKRALPSSPQKLQKLRIQSPQKLRERINSDRKAIANAESSLQVELSKIGEELSALKLNPTTLSSGPSRSNSTASTNQFTNRIATLQAQLSSLSSEFSARHNALEKEITTVLNVSERKVKKLDELYRDAGRENEALYERFNEELSKVMKNANGADDSGVKELKTRLNDAGQEADILRRENWRLKREVLGLKALVHGRESVDGNSELSK